MFNLEARFFSPTNDYIGSIINSVDGTGHFNLSVKENKIGGLKSFKMSLSKKFDIPFYNLMETQFWVSGCHWFTGEMIVRPNQDQRSNKYVYEGRGYVSYLKKVNVDKLYQHKTIKEILIDLIENEMNITPIKYDINLINPPNINVIKMELNNKDVNKAVKDLLKLANHDYLNQQYTYGVDKNRKFYFDKIDNDIQKTFYEGFDYQDPSVKENIDDIVNKIRIFRAKEGVNDLEFVSEISDGESIGLYDERIGKFEITDYVDNTTAEKIANARLELLKDPKLQVDIKALDIELDAPFNMGFYRLFNKRNNYHKIISECEDVGKWDIQTNKVLVSASNEKVLTGKKAFKCIAGSGGAGDYIELTLDIPIYFPKKLIFYISQNVFGKVINIQIFDTEGNFFGIETGFLLMEAGENIILENGDLLELEDGGLALNVLLENDFQKQEFDITNLLNIHRVRVNFSMGENMIIVEENETPIGLLLTSESSDPIDYIVQEKDEQFLLFLDRLEVETNSYKTNDIILDQIEYIFDDVKMLANATFGDKPISGVSELKKLGNRQANLFNILTKS